MKLFQWQESPTVVLTDDDLIFREMLSTILSREGYRVLQADGEDSTTAICRDTPRIDLAILDIELGRGSGIDLAEKIHPLPVLFVTNHDEQHLMEEALKGRAHIRALGYLSKQIEPQRMALIVRAAVSFAREARAKESMLENIARTLEAERHRIAQELHDELAQVLISVLFDARRISRSDASRAVKDTADQIYARIKSVEAGIQRIIDRLRPEVIDTLGVRGAIESLVAEWRVLLPGTSFTLNIDEGADDVGPEIGVAIYRIVQECLTNIAKYANAHNVDIRLAASVAGGVAEDARRHTLRLAVTDDGIGFDTRHPSAGYGLEGVHYRSAALGGVARIESVPLSGTEVTVEIPFRGSTSIVSDL